MMVEVLVGDRRILTRRCLATTPNTTFSRE
jgi:hypothetical protein